MRTRSTCAFGTMPLSPLSNLAVDRSQMRRAAWYSLTDASDAKRTWEVAYEFTVERHIGPRHPAGLMPMIRSSYLGTVMSLDHGVILPEGLYALTIEGGQTVRAQRLGLTWHILASA